MVAVMPTLSDSVMVVARERGPVYHANGATRPGARSSGYSGRHGWSATEQAVSGGAGAFRTASSISARR
jgi:hypothetical protein